MPEHDIVLVLYNIRSRFNVGAIFRTADAAGVKRIILCGITPQPPHPKIDKVALGAEKTVTFTYCRQTKRALDALKATGYQLVALEQSSMSKPYSSVRLKRKRAYVLGAEITGLPKRLLNICDQIIEIPMHGKKESLNVGIAAGIVLFHSIKP